MLSHSFLVSCHEFCIPSEFARFHHSVGTRHLSPAMPPFPQQNQLVESFQHAINRGDSTVAVRDYSALIVVSCIPSRVISYVDGS